MKRDRTALATGNHQTGLARSRGRESDSGREGSCQCFRRWVPRRRWAQGEVVLARAFYVKLPGGGLSGALVQESRRETVVGEDKLNEVKSKIRGGFFFHLFHPFSFPRRTCAGRIMQDECSDC